MLLFFIFRVASYLPDFSTYCLNAKGSILLRINRVTSYLIDLLSFIEGKRDLPPMLVFIILPQKKKYKEIFSKKGRK